MISINEFIDDERIINLLATTSMAELESIVTAEIESISLDLFHPFQSNEDSDSDSDSDWELPEQTEEDEDEDRNILNLFDD